MEQRRHFTAQLKTSFQAKSKVDLQTYFANGTVIGGVFKIDSIVGEGGMGVVYRAFHQAMGKFYALKILAPELINEQNWLRFKAEAKTLGSLNHPTLVKVYDLGIHENSVPYYSMDYLAGRNLEDVVANDGPLPLEQVIDIFTAVLEGLAYAHRNGIVHRDIKPANIFLRSVVGGVAGRYDVKILDFGISKFTHNNQFLTAAGEVFGSPFYMSPEQCRGEAVDARSDIYSVACSMFESLTAQVPFEGANSVETALMHEEEPPPTLAEVSGLNFPLSMDAVLARALSKRPENRYQSAKEMVLDLERVKAGRVVEMPKVAVRRVEVGNLSRGKLLLGLLGISLVVLAASLLVSSSSGLFSHPAITPIPQSATDKSTLVDLTIKDDFDISNADDISPRMAADVKEFFQSSPSFYSRQVKSGSRLVKGYSFPEKFCIGVLGGAVNGKNYSCAAQGRLVLPFGAMPSFTANFIVRHFPEFLDYFKADDLSGFSQFEKVERSERLMDSLGRLTSLRSINLFNVGVKDTEIGPLNNLTNLTILSLQRNEITPLSLSRLHILRNLRVLRVDGGTNISPLLKALAASRNLENLAITSATLSPQDVRYLSTMGNLKELTLGRTNLSDADLETLTSLQNLRVIDLKNSNLSNAAVITLLKLKKLESIYIPDMALTEAEKRQLREHLANLRTIRQ